MPHLPRIALNKVFHIGTLDPADLGRNSGQSSLEGMCLSVSLCPNAWQEIASLGGYPLHVLCKEGATFIDVQETRNLGLMPAVIQWGVERGLAVETELWRAWQYDEEAGEWTWSLFETKEDAAEELEFFLGEGEELSAPSGHEAVEPMMVPVATRQLQETTGMALRRSDDASDALLLAYGMLETDADGVWWNEEFRPEQLSAPRGGIFPDKVPSWSTEPISFNDVDDETEITAGLEDNKVVHFAP